MRGMNKVMLVGTLGKDPEIRQAKNGQSVVQLSVATSEQWTDKQTQQKQERTEWHRVVIFGKLADIAGQYLSKGSHVYLEGKLQTRKWQDASGIERYTTEIVLDISGVMLMLGGGASARQEQGVMPEALPLTNVAHLVSDGDDSFDRDDIPF